MPRTYRLLAVLTLATLVGALPAAAASGVPSLLDSFSPLPWLREIWASVPRAGHVTDSRREPHSWIKALWSETGIGIDPAGQPLASGPQGAGTPRPAQP